MEPLGELTISTHGRGNLVSGSVTVVSEGSIGGVLRYALPGIGVTGVGASPPVRDALFPVRQEGGLDTAAAIHNLTGSDLVVTCRLMKNGAVLEETQIPLAANGQEAQYIEEMFTFTDVSDFVGSVRCTVPPGEGMFTGVAVEIDEGNRIFTTLPVVPVQRAADDVRSIEARSGGEEPKTAEGKGDDDDKGGDKGDDDDDGGVGSRLICVGNVRDVQTTVPAAAANYTVAYDRYLTPGCASYVNNRYFGKDVPWISYSSAANDGRLITYTVAANTTTSVRTGNIWIIDIVNNNTPTGRTAITQRERNSQPTVSLACDPAAVCNGAETYTGQTVTLTATAADPNSHDTLHYEWAIDGPGVLGDGTGINTEASVVWRAGKAGTDTRITVTVVDRENPEASDKLEASATVTIRTVAPPDCYIALSGNLTDFGQGTGFPVGADVGQLYYALSRDNRCTDPVLSDFRTTAPGWIRALSMDTSTDLDHPRENKDGWDHFIEFQVDANPTYAIRQADVWVAGSSERSTLRQQAATRPRPTCPTTAITHTRTGWTVGGRYRGSGFTQPWAKMGYGTPGGCRVNGLSLSQPGHVKVCGYNVADADAQAACAAAPAAARATHSTDPTAGAVTTATGNTAAAQWVEFLVDEKTPTGGTLSLAVGTSSGGVYLHFGYEHESDLSYGDSDYERWNVGTPTWTFSPAASTTSGSAVTHPTLTEHGRYPGVFLVTCVASNGRPTGSDTNADTDDGFSVRVSAAQGSPSVTYTASAAHPTYPRICKP